MTTAAPRLGRVVLLEVYSVAHALAAIGPIRRADTIIVSRRVPFRRPAGLTRGVVRRLIRAVNSGAEIRELAVGDLLEYLPLNAEAMESVGGLADAIRETSAYRVMRRITGGDDRLVRYYQGALVREAPNWRLFPVVARRFQAAATALSVIPSFATGCAPDAADAFHGLDVPAPTRLVNRLGRACRGLAARASLAAMPLVFAATRLRVRAERAPAKHYKVAMPVVWGVGETTAKAAGTRSPHADDFLYGGSLKPGDVLHVFGDWSFPDAVRRKFKDAFAARGLPYADKERLALDLRTLHAAASAFVHTLRLLVSPMRRVLDPFVLAESPKALYHFLRKTHELNHLRYDTEFVKNDYNPGHVIASLVAAKRGVRTVGQQHNALPFEAPQLAFVQVDDLLVFGPLYVKAYGRHWAGLNVHCTGRETIDWVTQLSTDPAARAAVAARWAARHQPRARNVLVLFPGAHEICIPRQWQQLHEALVAVAATAVDANIILRFRNRQSLRSREIAQFAELPALDSRFVIEWEAFSTYELLAVSDIVITHDGSFTVNESLASGADVFTFEFVTAGHHYFPGYGRDFVLRTREDVIQLFARLESGEAQFDCRWDALRRDLNCHQDGGNRERMRHVLQAAPRRVPSTWR